MIATPEAVVIGAGGHAKVGVATLEAAGIRVTEVLDDDEDKWGTALCGVPVRGPVELAPRLAGPAVVAVGDNRARYRLVGACQAQWLTVVHPTAWVDPRSRLGPGSVVFAGAVVQPGSVLGTHVIVNTVASVDHDCRVGDFVHLAPRVSLAGGVEVGEGALLGMGSVVLPGVSIGAWATVGAGAVVVDDVPDGGTVVGVPARPLA